MHLKLQGKSNKILMNSCRSLADITLIVNEQDFMKSGIIQMTVSMKLRLCLILANGKIRATQCKNYRKNE